VRITVEYEAALKSLQHNPDFRKFLSWVGVEAELANERLIFNNEQDVNLLRGRTQALAELLKAIDDYYKRTK
jgi:hypothetical protein